IVSDGCATDQATATVTVHAMPSAGQDGTMTVCLNEPFDLLLGLDGNVDFGGIWYNANNQAMPSNLDTSGNIGGQFNYDYIVTHSYCPSDTANVLVVVDASCDYTASINELNNAWNVYPNPSSDIIQIVLNGELQMNQVQILDQNSKVLLARSVVSNGINELDINSLATGVYTIRLMNETLTLNKRFIKQ
ncbi:MAG: T9SS type A sorting domain-containing protein, partial [Cryomorphaceae bacterium]|nr:T9SS type A sorting domain-containing protein [Cryomorphaceae bacterium]